MKIYLKLRNWKIMKLIQHEICAITGNEMFFRL